VRQNFPNESGEPTFFLRAIIEKCIVQKISVEQQDAFTSTPTHHHAALAVETVEVVASRERCFSAAAVEEAKAPECEGWRQRSESCAAECRSASNSRSI
jgi:hypothetical protein